ncbi:hypothetical protein J5J83_07880 [Azoarcus sp. L1K30]|uniref:tetratricopeptide repeat protein n=1 Tax=Azoarcus sp. L1K30 TaxID=2820277 RepID=UPI001B829B4D|nr:tetratricopeptide repeat protein [Azoarcus sp. L1K30]MBR0566031.1 hypothetical protein [Azoarcus sp. L1K30]
MTNCSKGLVAFTIALLTLTAAIYLPHLGSELIFDDNRLIDGTVFGAYADPLQIKQRLVSYGSFVWSTSLLGEGWWKQRLINILFHVGSSIGLFVLVRGLMANIAWPRNDDGHGPTDSSLTSAAAIGTLLFALNPVAVYGVAYLIQRSILMATLFSIWALVFVFFSARRERPGLLWIALLLYFFALLSKEHALLLPLPAAALYLFSSRFSRKQRIAISSAVFFLVAFSATFFINRYGDIVGSAFDRQSQSYLALLETMKPGVGQEVYGLSILNQAWLFFRYGALWMIPNVEWMSIDLRPAFPLEFASVPQVFGLPLYLGLLSAATFMMFRFADWRRYAGFAIFTPSVLFATEFATVWIQDPFVLYRSYLWAIGMPFLFALPFVGAKPRTILLIAMIICPLFAGLAFERAHSLSTEFNAWNDAAEKVDLSAAPNAVGRSRAFLNRGNQFVARGMLNVATNDYMIARQLGDSSGTADYHLGGVLLATGKLDDALAAFKRAEAGNDTAGFAHLLLVQKADTLFRMQRFQEAEAEAERALSMELDRENRIRTLSIHGGASFRLGNFESALQDYSRLMEEEPSKRSHKIAYAMTLNGMGQHQEAMATISAISQQAEGADVSFARIMILHAGGKTARAVAELRSSLIKWPGDKGLNLLREKLQRAQ